MTDPRELLRLHTFFVARAGVLGAVFVIDGRTYRDPDAVVADVAAAFDALQRRRLIAEFITRPVRPDSPRPGLPSWLDWAARIPCLGRHPDPPGTERT